MIERGINGLLKQRGGKKMKSAKWFGFLLLLFLLTGCMEPNHSIQLGTVDQNGTIQLSDTIKNEETYQKGIDAFNNGRNIKIIPSELKSKKTYYIQFKDDNQNIVISNYDVWFDDIKNRVIFTDHVKAYSYYEITNEEKDFIQNLILKGEERK